MDIIVGTAGHIDHGKTALVKALTGVDADRLPEEKQRGITVDIGFAETTVDDVHFGFVDVPGHERFVKNMLAGASGIDLVLLVVAADEGVMPQTREHFEICRLLGITAGVIALTKSDLVDDETSELARLDVSELVAGSFLQNSPMISVSSRTGNCIDELKRALQQASRHVVRKHNDLTTRLPIDRSFSMPGFGGVVTGTLASGELIDGSPMEIMPDGWKTRIRGLQTHGTRIDRVSTGRRVAVNLGGIDQDRINRGMVLTEFGALGATQVIDAQVEVLRSVPRPLRTRQRARIHLGTVEALARLHILNGSGEIGPGETDFAQIRLEVPVVAVPGERLIIRSYSPQVTISGGEVIDPLAIRHRRKDLRQVRDLLSRLHEATNSNERRIEILVHSAGSAGTALGQLRNRTGLNEESLKRSVDRTIVAGTVVKAGDVCISKVNFQTLTQELIRQLESMHRDDRLSQGVSKEVIREALFRHSPAEIFKTAVDSLRMAGSITVDKELLRLSTHRIEMSPFESALRDAIRERYRGSGLEVPKADEALSAVAVAAGAPLHLARRLLQVLLSSGDMVKATEEFYFSKEAIDGLIMLLRQHAAKGDRVIDVPTFKDIAGVSRKYAIPLLEYLDREHITARAGDKRVIL